VSVDDSAARKVKGYIRTLVLEDPSETVPGWVMVIAASYPAAIRAADLLQVEWTAGAAVNVSEKDIQAHASELIAKPDGGVLLDTGGGRYGYRAESRTIDARTDLYDRERLALSA
jgi:hypothetical protein